MIIAPTRATGFRTAWLLIAAILAACGRDDTAGARAEAAGSAGARSAEFVGGARCAECHTEAAAAHRGSHHDLAMQEVAADTVLGDFGDVTFRHGEGATRFHRDGARYLVTTEGPDGTEQTYEVAYVFGVEPLQQYLIEFPGGRLQCLTIAWDSRPAARGGQRWFTLYPDDDFAPDHPLHWTGRNQTWNQMCAACHSTGLRKNYDLESDSYETAWSDIDVSCEACHGPGSRHVAWAEAGATPGGDAGLLVDLGNDATWSFAAGEVTAHREPERSGPSAEVETCAPCHARRSELVDTAWHGKPFLDTHRPTLLERDLYHADGQILDEVYVWGSFVQSKMYHAGVTCADCHQPHRTALRAEDNALCTRCHRADEFDVSDHHFHEPGTAGAACVECHMPETTYMVVDPRRDHSLRVPRPDLAATLGTPDACTACHRDQDSAWAARAIAARRDDAARAAEQPAHYGTAIRAGRVGGEGAGALLRELAGDDTAPGIARATALTLYAERPDRRTATAVAAALGDPDPLVRLGAAEALDGLPPARRVALIARAVRDPVRAVRAEAARALGEVPSARLPAEARDAYAAALQEFLHSQRLNADRSWGRVNLAVALQQRGDRAAAIRHYEAALEQEPRAVRPWVNLADLYRADGDDARAASVLRRGLRHAFETPELEHSLGLLLVRQGERHAALDHLRRAAAARPEQPRYAYVLGVALIDTGHTDEGFAVLEEAVRRHPHDVELLSALATLERDRGRRDAAERWAERLVRVAPDDPGAQRLLRQLRSGR